MSKEVKKVEISIEEQVIAINTKKVTEEIFEAIKVTVGTAMPKLLTGESFTSGEVICNKYISDTLMNAKRKGDSAAERAAKLKQAEAIYKTEMQKYNLGINADLLEIGEAIVGKCKSTDNKFVDVAELRSFMKERLANLPKAPRKPGVGGGTRGNGDSTYKAPGDIDPAKARGIAKHIVEVITAAEENVLTVEALSAMCILHFTDRKPANVEWSVGDSLKRLPPEFAAKLKATEIVEEKVTAQDTIDALAEIDKLKK